MACRSDFPHARPCGPTDEEAVCACGCSGYDEGCGTYTSNHPDDTGVPEGMVLGELGIPDGLAYLNGEWFRITNDGVGYGEFDRERA